MKQQNEEQTRKVVREHLMSSFLEVQLIEAQQFEAQAIQQMDGSQDAHKIPSLRLDALWKPLMRLFRRFLKKNALPKETFEWIKGKSIFEQG